VRAVKIRPCLNAMLVVAALVGAAACDSSTRPSRIVEPGWALRPADGTLFRRGRSQAVTVTVESLHLKDARLSLAAVYSAPDGSEYVEAFPAGNDREDLPEGYVHLPSRCRSASAFPTGHWAARACRRAAARSRCAHTWTRPLRRFPLPAGLRRTRSWTDRERVFPGVFARSWNG
jgi:hypothetical protein